ncbi:MAG: glycerate 2-kinase [Actinomycetota bacterium]|nr:glycerate 2-kinase [Actinomycetota bacterium]
MVPDSFGGTLSAAQAAEAVALGWADGAPHDRVDPRPLSDGGPGFVEVLHATVGGDLLTLTVSDPLGRPVPATVLLAGGTAYVESAQACGLHHLAADERDPRVASSYGVGLLLAAAVEAGARRVVVGLGGSATNDGGAGMYAALGAPPLGADGLALPYGGAALAACAGLGGVPALRGAEVVLASDVDNPLLGLHGASAVYGPQKGADRADVLLLDAALQTWAEVLVADLPGCPPDLATLPGGGAAGGLGAALLAVGGHREPGIELVRTLVGLDDAMDRADLVITGEGSFDSQSLRGKVVSGVAGAALERGVPCLVLAGQVHVGKREAAAAGIEAAYSLAEHAGSVDEALRRPAEALRSLAARVAKEWSRG